MKGSRIMKRILKTLTIIGLILAVSPVTISAAENTTSEDESENNDSSEAGVIEYQGYEFKIGDNWTTEENDGDIKCYLADPAAIISFHNSLYDSDSFAAQYQLFDDSINANGEKLKSFSREEITRYTTKNDIMFLIGRYQYEDGKCTIAYLPDKSSNSIIIIQLTEYPEGDSVSSDFYDLLDTIKPIEDKIPQKDVWEGAEMASADSESSSADTN